MKEKRKSLFSNFLYNSIYTGLNVIFPLLTIPYVSRIIYADGMGRVNYAINIVSWFLLFASLGIPRYGIREIAKNASDQKKLNKSFSELFIINGITTLFCICIYLIMFNTISIMHNDAVLYKVVGVQLLFNFINVDWLYQGLEEYEYITKRSILIKFISLMSIFLFVKQRNDYIVYAFIQSVGVAGNNLFNLIKIKKYVGFQLRQLEIKRHINPIIILVATQLAVSVYTLLDTTMLGALCNTEIVGYYSNCQKIVKVIATICSALSGIMLPRFVAMVKKNDICQLQKLAVQTLEIIIWLCIPIMFGLMVLSPVIVKLLFGNDFLPCIDTLKLFSPFIVFTTVGNLFGTQLLMSFNEERKLLLSVLIGAIMNFVLNIVLIPRFMQNGAAFASLIAELLVMTVQIKLCDNYLRVKLHFEQIFKIFVQSLVMVLVLFWVKKCVQSEMLIIVFSLVFGGGIYLLTGMLLRTKIQRDIIKIVCKNINIRKNTFMR